MASPAISKIQISFWQPINRQRRHTLDLHIKIAETFFDYVIDPLYTSPFASKACGVTQWHRPINSWSYTLTSRDIPIDRLGQLIRVVVVVAGLIYRRRTTVALLATGLAIKVFCRSKETYYINSSGGPRPVSAHTQPRISAEQEERNLEKWAQKWWCDTMFYLFAIGSDDTITLPRKVSEEEDRMVEVYIGVTRSEYPLSFLNSLPFFRFLMSSGMRDVQEGRIHLTGDFPYTHSDLQSLRARLESTDATQWEDCSEHDFLCVGLRQNEAPHVWKFGEMQRIIVERDYPALRSCFPGEPPGVKVGSYTFNFLPEVHRPMLNFEGKEDVEAKGYAIECLQVAMKQETSTLRHYHVNRIINEFVHHLYQNHRREITRVDLITPLFDLFDSHPGVAFHLTVLDLPPMSLESERGERLLPKVLGACRNLKWLALESFHESFRIDTDDRESLRADLHRSTNAQLKREEELPKDVVERHEGLRILKMEGQALTPGQVRKLRELFPNLDILEAQVLKIT